MGLNQKIQNERYGLSDTIKDTIKIAVAAPMTGDNSEYGIGFTNAANLMAKQWNEKGGVLGKEVEIVPYDDKNTSEEATTIAQKIVSDKEVAGEMVLLKFPHHHRIQIMQGLETIFSETIQ